MLIQRYFIRKKAFRVVQVLLGIIPCWSATDYGEFFSFACSCCSAYNNMCEILIWREKLPNMQVRLWFVFIYQPKKQQYHPWTTRTAWKKMSTWICRPCRSTRPCRTTVCRRLGRHRSTHQVSNQGKNEMQRADVERILLQTGLQSSALWKSRWQGPSCCPMWSSRWHPGGHRRQRNVRCSVFLYSRRVGYIHWPRAWSHWRMACVFLREWCFA